MTKDLGDTVKSHVIRVAGREEPTVIVVVKSIIEEMPDLKAQAKIMMPLIKAEIASYQQLSREEKEELVSEEKVTPSPVGNEYEDLVTLLKEQLLGVNELKENITSLLLYGSYGKGDGFYILGQSDVNILLILRDNSTSKVSESLNKAIEPIVTNPLFSHLFDLVVLSKSDLESPNRLEESFSTIHALSAKNCDHVLIGQNILKNFDPSLKEIKLSARRLVQEACLRFGIVLQQMRESESGDEEDQMYYAGEAAISVALALLHFTNGKSETAVKAEVGEKFKVLIGNDQTWSKYGQLIDWAHAIRLGVRLSKPDQLIEAAGSFCREVQIFMNNWANQNP